MARVAVAHATYEVLGGAEKLSLYLARALSEAGHEVTVVTCEPPDPARLSSLFGGAPRWRLARPARLCPRLHRLVGRLARGRAARLRRLLFYRSFFRALARLRGAGPYDLVFETQSNLPAPADASYIHFPSIMGYGMGRAYPVYNHLVRLLAREVLRLGRPGLALTNSAWTAGLVRRAYGLYPLVLHPPVEVRRYDGAYSGPHAERVVLSVSRLSVEKGVHRLAALAAALRPLGYQVYLVGATCPDTPRALALLEGEADRLRADNLVVLRDLPLPRLLELMAEARYYVHPEYPEHFGLSVVEAMAAGLVPLVYREGGAWTDVVSRVDPSLGYRRVEEAAAVVRALDRDPARYARLRARARRVAERFDYPRFARRVARLASWLLRVRELAASADPRPPWLTGAGRK